MLLVGGKKAPDTIIKVTGSPTIMNTCEGQIYFIKMLVQWMDHFLCVLSYIHYEL